MQCKPLRRRLRESRIRWAAEAGAGFLVIATISQAFRGAPPCFTIGRSVLVPFTAIRGLLGKRITLSTLYFRASLRNVSFGQHCCIKASVG